jgi:glutamyl-tRNA synthetase
MIEWFGLDAVGRSPARFDFAKLEDLNGYYIRNTSNQELLQRGNAYRCYCTPDELDAMRRQAEAEGRSPIYNGTWRDRDPAEAPAGVKAAIRLKTPRTGETVIEDQVQGRVVFQNENLDDLIILRSDGTPTYNLAVVVDDHDMGITHVIRGVDHLTNAARQTQIYLAMGWDVPVFAHVPLIHGPDGAKLSKRHGALGVEAYRAMGYLPAALRNYLVRLGWSHGNEEIIPTERMIEWFGLDAVGRSPARFDFAKLEDLNGYYIRNTGDEELLTRIRQMLPEMENGPELEARFAAVGWEKLAAALPSLKERAKTLEELVRGAAYLIAERPLALDEKAAKLLNDDSRALLGRLLPRLAATDHTAAALEAEVRRFAEAEGLKLGNVAQPLRAALTGRLVSPPIFDVMAVLGREEALARIEDQANS